MAAARSHCRRDFSAAARPAGIHNSASYMYACGPARIPPRIATAIPTVASDRQMINTHTANAAAESSTAAGTLAETMP